MEHERGAFKVKPATSADAVKKWLEIHGFHPPCGHCRPASIAKIPCQNFSQTTLIAQKIDSLPSKHTFF
jgi:hypothetical protein